MIIKKITKTKKDYNYNVIIDDNSYVFCEDIVIEYRLYEGKEIEEDVLELAISSNDIHSYYEMALKYSLKYVKGSKEVFNYLINKGLDEENSHKIIDMLIEKKVIDDKKIIESIIYSLIINYNGKNMIREKLRAKGFDYILIDEGINNIDHELYFEYLNKMYEKIKHKYDKYNDYLRRMKIKQYLYQRGYDGFDIDKLEIL